MVKSCQHIVIDWPWELFNYKKDINDTW